LRFPRFFKNLKTYVFWTSFLALRLTDIALWLLELELELETVIPVVIYSIHSQIEKFEQKFSLRAELGKTLVWVARLLLLFCRVVYVYVYLNYYFMLQLCIWRTVETVDFCRYFLYLQERCVVSRERVHVRTLTDF